MTTFANRKFSKVIDKYLETGDVAVSFDKDTLVTTLNGEGFTPVESQQLVDDFGGHPIFSKIMRIVNDSPVASEARNHINSVKTLQDALLGLSDEDEDLEEDWFEDVNSYDHIDKDIDEDKYRQVSLEEFLDVIGEDKSEELFEALVEAERIVEEEGGEVAVEIPGLGLAVISSADEGDNDSEDFYEMIQELITDASGIDSDLLEEFEQVKGTFNALPSGAKSMVKTMMLATLGQTIIKEADNAGFSEEETAELYSLVVELIGKVDVISGDDLPEPQHFIEAIQEILTEKMSGLL